MGKRKVTKPKGDASGAVGRVGGIVSGGVGAGVSGGVVEGYIPKTSSRILNPKQMRMDFFSQLHPVTKGGLLLMIISLGIFIAAFRGVDIGQVVKVSGRASQSVKWQNRVFKLIVSFIGLGVLLSMIGFALPSWEQSGSTVSERTWYNTWSINFHCNSNEVPILQDAETIRFYRYPHKGENIFEAQIKDAEGREIGSFQRLEPSLENDDYRVIKGQCKINGGKTIVVELALHGNKEVFSGVIFESKSVKKHTCWGKKH